VLLFLDFGTRTGWVVSTTPRPLYTPGKDQVLIVQDAGWTPGPAWTCEKKLVPTGIRSPDRRARSQSLYRLNYPGPKRCMYVHSVKYLTSYVHVVVKAFKSGGIVSLILNLDTRLRYFTWTLSVI
jgi:hypothetical protein